MMPTKKPSVKKTIEILITIVLPIILIIVNHAIWIDNIILSIGLLSWMGFSILAFQPFDVGEYETIEP